MTDKPWLRLILINPDTADSLVLSFLTDPTDAVDSVGQMLWAAVVHMKMKEEQVKKVKSKVKAASKKKAKKAMKKVVKKKAAKK